MGQRDLHHLKITSPTGHGLPTTVELDGEENRGGIKAIDLRVDAEAFNTATLELLAPTFEVDGEFQIMLPEETQTLLKRLGWTPPA